jgi:catechol 2,3-dioxygenase-like lactoylglutathione lyase family enzyme
MRPEVVVLPVTDVDRAKTCYQDLGWRLDADFADDGYRVVQSTPPGSNTSIIFATGVTSDQPGSMFPIRAWELESPEIAWFWWLTTSSRP